MGGDSAAERDFDEMNQADLRKVAKELGVRQCGVRVAELKDACKRAAEAAAKEACEGVEPEAERDFESMNKEELRMVAKELGVRQRGANVAELKAACKCVVREQQQQKTLIVRLVGNACVADAAATLAGSNSGHSGAGAVLELACQALPAAWKCITVKPISLWSKGRLAKVLQLRNTSKLNAKRRRERAILMVKDQCAGRTSGACFGLETMLHHVGMHMDFQATRSKEAVLEYITKYMTKCIDQSGEVPTGVHPSHLE